MYSKKVVSLELVDQLLSGERFEDCLFKGCRFEQLVFRDVRFTECRFEDCELVACRFVGCTMEGSFKSSRLMGCDLTGLDHLILRLSFQDCCLDHSTFAGLPLAKTTFLRCSVKDVDFSGTDLRGAKFHESNLEGAILRHARLEHSDLSGTTGCMIDVRTCKLLKTNVGVGTSLAILEELGLECKDLKSLLGG